MAGLHVRKSPLCEVSCRALAEALRRDVWIESLLIEECHLSRETCHMICDAVADNLHVRALTLFSWHGAPFHRGALQKHLHYKNSALTELNIGWESTQGKDDDDELTSLLALLRTNVRLEVLTVWRVAPSRCAVVRDLVRTNNFTLHRVVLPDVPDHEQLLIDGILDSNRRVRRNWDRLHTDRAPHTVQPKLLPEALWRIGRFPTLIHRFLRGPRNAAILSGLA